MNAAATTPMNVVSPNSSWRTDRRGAASRRRRPITFANAARHDDVFNRTTNFGAAMRLARPPRKVALVAGSGFDFRCVTAWPQPHNSLTHAESNRTRVLPPPRQSCNATRATLAPLLHTISPGGWRNCDCTAALRSPIPPRFKPVCNTIRLRAGTLPLRGSGASFTCLGIRWPRRTIAPRCWMAF